MELLKEIILINDKSTFEELYEPLKNYVTKHFSTEIKIHVNDDRQGLIVSRMNGARLSSAEVIIFLDSHMEVGINWMPPLLQPLLRYPKIATVPIIDSLNSQTLAYEFTGHGYRGIFDWNFRYQWLPLRPNDKIVTGQPFELACMTGGAYAIRKKNFFRLGGYDEGH